MIVNFWRKKCQDHLAKENPAAAKATAGMGEYHAGCLLARAFLPERGSRPHYG
jgi:hypothetical protein